MPPFPRLGLTATIHHEIDDETNQGGTEAGAGAPERAGTEELRDDDGGDRCGAQRRQVARSECEGPHHAGAAPRLVADVPLPGNATRFDLRRAVRACSLSIAEKWIEQPSLSVPPALNLTSE
jgi:hypothetical protein